MNINPTLSAAISASALAFATSAGAVGVFPEFEVNPALYAPGKSVFTADKITGNYVEVITFGAGTFETTLLWNAGQFVANDGTTAFPGGGPGGTGLGANYGLYALFRASGTFATAGGTTTLTLDPAGSSFGLYLDPQLDTAFSTPGSGAAAWGVAQNGADVLLGNGAGLFGVGSVTAGSPGCAAGINCGSFGQNTSLALTAAGATFFQGPTPFFDESLQSGQFNLAGFTATQTTNGSLDVVFRRRVPEPSSIALFGLALFGLASARRRKI